MATLAHEVQSPGQKVTHTTDGNQAEAYPSARDDVIGYRHAVNLETAECVWDTLRLNLEQVKDMASDDREVETDESKLSCEELMQLLILGASK